MILADSTAWVEYFRATGSPVDRHLAGLIAQGAGVATTEPVVMEVLAGARDEPHRRILRRTVLASRMLAVDGLDDYESAADLYRTARRAGITVRRMLDCLIAAVAIREDVELLHDDSDFEQLASCSPLRVVRLNS